MTHGRLALVVLVAVPLVSSVSAQAQTGSQDAARFRTFSFQRNFETGAIDGQQFTWRIDAIRAGTGGGSR